MYFWNVKKAIQALRKDTITERQKMYYVLIHSLLAVAFVELLWYFPVPIEHVYVEIAVSVGSVALLIYGILIAFRANEQGDNKDFVSRYIVLGLPIGIRVFVYGIVIYIGYYILSLLLSLAALATFGNPDMSRTEIENFSETADFVTLVGEQVVLLGIMVIGILWMRSAVRRVAARE